MVDRLEVAVRRALTAIPLIGNAPNCGEGTRPLMLSRPEQTALGSLLDMPNDGLIQAGNGSLPFTA
jgi:hypothetical protein